MKCCALNVPAMLNASFPLWRLYEEARERVHPEHSDHPAEKDRERLEWREAESDEGPVMRNRWDMTAED